MPVWNRESILELFARELARSASSGSNLTVMLAGIDPLKNTNRNHAEFQDSLFLGEVAKRLTASLRAYDYMGRYSPKQLLILAPEWEPSSSLALAEKLRETVTEASIEIPGARTRITISLATIATANFNSHRRDQGQVLGQAEILQQMEAALDQIQKNGGNRAELLGAPSSNVRHIVKRRGIRISWAVGGVLVLALAALIFLLPSWTCAPNLVSDIFDSGELPPPLPVNCALTPEKASETTIQSIEKEREAGELEFQGMVTCKVPSSSALRARSGNLRDQQWLGSLYTDGRLQYRRHVLIAASQDVPGGRLFVVEQDLMPWWKYIGQSQEYCRVQDLPWT